MLSIIIPSFNDIRILRAIASVRRFDDTGMVQMVIVDGGSDEPLIGKVREVLAPQDLLISERDGGIFDGLNKGLKHAAGDLIGWIGSDDIFHTAVKASRVIASLETADLYIGGTAMVRKDRVKRMFWLPRDPARAAFMGLHNPHFSTFGRAGLLRRAAFDTNSPVADIRYFLEIFALNPVVHVDRRLVTLMQVGGFSNSTWRKQLAHNLLMYHIYREFGSPAHAVLATVIKILPKLASSVLFRLKPATISDEFLG